MAKTGPLGVKYSPLALMVAIPATVIIALAVEPVIAGVWQFMTALPKDLTALIVITGLGAIGLAFLSANLDRHQNGLKVGALTALVCEVALFAYAVFFYYPATMIVASITHTVVQLVPPDLTAVFMECHMTAFPFTIPARTTLHLIPANKNYMKSNTWGFYDIPNDTDKDTQWPNTKTMKERLKHISKNDAFTGEFGYRCEVSNHGPDNILYLGVPLDFNYDNDKPAIRYQPVISSLDVGKSFVFYITNDCPEMASIIWQQEAKVRTQQHPELHGIKLLREYHSMIDQIMLLPPSSIPWAGQFSCK